MRKQFISCPECEAHLDPGEVCECTKKAPSAATLRAGSDGADTINTKSIAQMIEDVKPLFNVHLVDNPNWDGVAVFMPDTQTWNLVTLEETIQRNILRVTAELMRRKAEEERAAV